MAAKKNAAATEVKIKPEQAEQKFNKEQILASVRYANKRDLVDALLDDGEKYTLASIDKKIDDYMKGKVK